MSKQNETQMRSGDIEALRSKMRDEGRPLKSNIIMGNKEQIIYGTNKEGHVEIKERLSIG